MTLPTGTVRMRPWRTGSAIPWVAVTTAEPAGDLHRGYVEVPLRLCGTKQHTNERLEFMGFVRRHLTEWVAWKARKGLEIADAPRFVEATDPLGDQGAEHEASRWYWFEARFRLARPQFMRLSDADWMREQAARYGVDLAAPKPTETPVPAGVDFIDDGRPAHRPLRFAAERREALGLERSDLLIGDITEPLSAEDAK